MGPSDYRPGQYAAFTARLLEVLAVEFHWVVDDLRTDDGRLVLRGMSEALKAELADWVRRAGWDECCRTF